LRASTTHLVIGRVVAPRGIRGELKVEIHTEDPERFHHLPQVYLGDGYTRYAVTRARLFKGQALLQLEGIETREDAELWRNAYVYISLNDALPLDADEFYHYQLIGLAVHTEEGEALGRVAEVLATGANDVYVIRGEGGELLLPAIKEVIRQVDLEAGTMTVVVPHGLR
jgi:16S rRNA processing protein RimM